MCYIFAMSQAASMFVTDDDPFPDSVGVGKQNAQLAVPNPNLLSVDQLLLSVSITKIEMHVSDFMILFA